MQTLLVAGWQCLFSVKEYCGLHDTVGCLRNWPLIPVEANVHKYYNVELGWYLQLMLKHVMGEYQCMQLLEQREASSSVAGMTHAAHAQLKSAVLLLQLTSTIYHAHLDGAFDRFAAVSPYAFNALFAFSTWSAGAGSCSNMFACISCMSFVSIVI
jgi:hypothetical protein